MWKNVKKDSPSEVGLEPVKKNQNKNQKAREGIKHEIRADESSGII